MMSSTQVVDVQKEIEFKTLAPPFAAINTFTPHAATPRIANLPIGLRGTATPGSAPSPFHAPLR